MRRSPTIPNQPTRRDLLRWISIYAAAGLTGCGVGDSDAPDPADCGTAGSPTCTPGDPQPLPGTSRPGAGAAGSAVTPEQRVAAFAALEAKLGELHDAATGRTAVGPLLEWLAAQDAYQTVGYSVSRDAYAIFTDGRPLLITLRVRTDTVGISKAPLANSMSPRARPASAANRLPQGSMVNTFKAGIPSRQFRYLNTWFDTEGDWPAPVWCRSDPVKFEGVSGMHDIALIGQQMKRFGYEMVGGADAMGPHSPLLEVEALKKVSGDGVFFWTTHGGMIDPAGKVTQALMTATPATRNAVEDIYKKEFDEGTLVYQTGPLCLLKAACEAPAGEGVEFTRISITPKFIRKYEWRFGEHSLVFVNACLSGTGDMKQAFLDAGASVYLGWQGAVRVSAMCGAALDFFSLMLGLNENSAGMHNVQVTPMQRPYDWGAVMDHLHATTETARYQDDEVGLVQLEPTLNELVPPGFLGLRPSIYWTSFNESASELRLIGGLFGTHEGTAAIGTSMPCTSFENCSGYGFNIDDRLAEGQDLPIKKWTSEELVLAIPREGPRATGIVQVGVDGRWSNGMQLTRISLPVRATQKHAGTLEVRVEGRLSVRGDFRGVRLSPIEEPDFVSPVLCESSHLAVGRFTAAGQHVFEDNESTTRIVWSGSGEVGLVAPGISGLWLGGLVDAKARRGRFAVRITGHGITEHTTVTLHTVPPQEFKSTREIGFSIRSQVIAGQDDTVEVQFEPNYVAAEVRQAYSVVDNEPGGPADVITTLTCGPFTSEYPPDNQVGGR